MQAKEMVYQCESLKSVYEADRETREEEKK